MNLRIRELMEQATEPPEFPTDIGYFNPEKFAELIVRECIKEIEFQHGGGSDMDSEWDRAIECVSSMVKYRFGVEE